MEFLAKILEEHGGIAVALLVVVILFYKLTWRVWDRAMKAKDEEITRLVAERNKYQKLVFERLLTSDPSRQRTEAPTPNTNDEAGA